MTTLRSLFRTDKRPDPKNPALLAEVSRRREDAENRAADAITDFAGSMAFVYLRILWFGCWIVLGVED